MRGLSPSTIRAFIVFAIAVVVGIVCLYSRAPQTAATAAEPTSVTSAGFKFLLPAQLYHGANGEAVTVLMVDGKPSRALIHFTNIAGPWNNKSVVARVNNLGARGFDCETKLKKEAWVVFKHRGGKNDAYAPNAKDMRLEPTERAPASVNFDDLAHSVIDTTK